MKLLRYNNFRQDVQLNENLDQAKKLLRDTYKLNRAVKLVSPDMPVDKTGLFLTDKDGVEIKFTDLPKDIQEESKKKLREVKLTPDEIRNVERNEIITKVRAMLGDKLGYAYMFTYFALIERTLMEDLKNAFDKLIEYKDLLASNGSDEKPLMRRPISNYIDPSVPNNFEHLIDDIENIAGYKSTRKIMNEFTPILKKDYESQPPVIKKQIDDLAIAFSKLGMEDGKINKDVQSRLHKLFFGELKVLDADIEIRGVNYRRGDKIYSGQMFRYKDIRDFIRSAQNYLKNIDNTETVKFYEAIEKCNVKYGSYGAQVNFDESGILILEIKSFQANQMLNGHTRHCIKDSLSQWDYYVGGDSKFSKQYYIYNFNLPSYDTKSVIGITIDPPDRGTDQKIMACHLKDDGAFSSGIKSLLKQWEKEYEIKEDLWSVLKPMTKQEIDEKKRRIVANREVIKKGLSLDAVKKYLVTDGADVNAGKGAPLDNAVDEDDIEKAKYLLDFGASANLKQKQEASVNKVKSFPMLKLLIANGAELTASVLKPLIKDYDAIEFCLDNGLDANFQDGVPARYCIKEGKLDVLKLLVSRGADPDPSGRMALMNWAYEYGHSEIVDYLMGLGVTKNFQRTMVWIGHSHRLEGKEKVRILKNIQKMIDEGKLSISDDDHRVFGTDPKTKKGYDLKRILDEYGNIYNFIIKMNGLDKYA